MSKLNNILNKNLYLILASDKSFNINQIKKSFYNLSKKLHPDINHNPEENKFFKEISEAWEILGNEELREEYDKKSKFGKDYNEFEEFFLIDMDYNRSEAESNYDKVKNREVLDIVINVDKSTFNGVLEFPRYVMCKTCKGSGKSKSMKIAIKNDKGEIRYIDSDDFCDFCEGSGQSWKGGDCSYCNGKGKVGVNLCNTCNGDKRYLGKQKLKNIVLSGEETKVEFMGHISIHEKGKVGHLFIKINLDN